MIKMELTSFPAGILADQFAGELGDAAPPLPALGQQGVGVRRDGPAKTPRVFIDLSNLSTAQRAQVEALAAAHVPAPPPPIRRLPMIDRSLLVDGDPIGICIATEPGKKPVLAISDGEAWFAAQIRPL